MPGICGAGALQKAKLQTLRRADNGGLRNLSLGCVLAVVRFEASLPSISRHAFSNRVAYNSSPPVSTVMYWLEHADTYMLSDQHSSFFLSLWSDLSSFV